VIELPASPALSPGRPRLEPTPTLARWAVERALHRRGASLGLEPLAVRAVLLRALLIPVRQGFGVVSEGTVRLGCGSGPRILLRMGGHRLLVPAQPGALDPASVTLVHRAPVGSVRVATHMRFGERPALEAAARAQGLCPQVGVGLLGAVVAQLGLVQVPTGARVRGHLERGRWEALRMVDVVPRVGSPVRQITLSDARHLVQDVRAGERVGVALPRQDWLTPLLHWVARPG